MPLLSTPDAAARFLRTAVESRAHWLFLTDSTHVTRDLVAFGVSLRISGVDGADLGFASFRYLVPASRHRADVTILTVPKRHLTEAGVRQFLGRFTNPLAVIAGRDIVPVGHDPEMLGGVLAAILDGKVQVLTSASAN